MLYLSSYSADTDEETSGNNNELSVVNDDVLTYKVQLSDNDDTCVETVDDNLTKVVTKVDIGGDDAHKGDTTVSLDTEGRKVQTCISEPSEKCIIIIIKLHVLLIYYRSF